MRDPDLLDYGLVIAVTVLAYLELPFRPEIRQRLRALFDVSTREVDVAVLEVDVGVVLIAGAFLGLFILVFITQVLPARHS